VTILVAVETLLLVLLTIVVAGLLRSHAEILRRLGPEGDREREEETFAPGIARPPARDGTSAAHDIAGTTPWGEAIQVGLAPGSPSTLIAFLSSGCLTCETFWTAFSSAERPPIPGGGRLLIVTKDGSHESPARLRELAPRNLPVLMSSQAWSDYEVPAAPYFAYVDGASGAVHGEGAATGWAQVSALLRDALEDIELMRRDAGLVVTPAAASAGARRAIRVDDELAAAGIDPGHPSLYPGGSGEEADG
jgi:hypothetical protein